MLECVEVTQKSFKGRSKVIQKLFESYSEVIPAKGHTDSGPNDDDDYDDDDDDDDE